MEENELTDSMKASAETVELEKCKEGGLGVRIVGGRSMLLSDGKSSDFGIYIKEIIPGRLADRHGRLKKGDQLLSANGRSLVSVSNSEALTILKESVSTDKITLQISRDTRSQSEFRRLSQHFEEHYSAKPMASSTPLHHYPASSSDPPPSTGSILQTPSATNQRNSSSSELTNITTTDISSHAEDEEDEEGVGGGEERGPLLPHGLLSKKRKEDPIGLSDVKLQVRSSQDSLSHGKTASQSGTTGEREEMETDDDDELPPPPPPSSLPPGDILEDTGIPPLSPPPPVPTSSMLKEDDEKGKTVEVTVSAAAASTTTVTKRVDTILDRKSPEGKSVSSPPPLSPLPRSILTIAKGVMGLGLRIGGGPGLLHGPYIVVEGINTGSDAAKDGRLQVGDRIISVNGESFSGISKERALTILTQMKGRSTVRSYTIEYERPEKEDALSDPNDGDSPFEFLSPQTMTPQSIFDSDTLPVSARTSEVLHSKTTPTDSAPSSGGKSVMPRRYMGKKETSERGKQDSLSRRLSMDPAARVSLEKLELALKFMGKVMTPEQKKLVHTKLDIDSRGKVIFSDFVQLAQEMFAFKMESSNLEAGLVLALTQKEDLELLPYSRKTGSMDIPSFDILSDTQPSPPKLSSSQPQISDLPPTPSSILSSSPPPINTERSGPAAVARSTEGPLGGHPELLLQPEMNYGIYHSGGVLGVESRVTPSAGPSAGLAKQSLWRRKESPGDSYLESTVSDTLLLRGAGPQRQVGGVLSSRQYTGEELNETQMLRKRVRQLETALEMKTRETELVKQEVVPGSSRETRQLRQQVVQSKEALAQKEHQYRQMEETIRHMEAELAGLRNRPPQHTVYTESTEDVRTRVAVLSCELKKEQDISKRFQVATDTLLQFVEECVEALVKSPEASKILYHRHGKGETAQRGDAVTGNPRPPPYLAKHAKVTAVTLADEARETMRAVHKMLQTKNLPYGWEETYTEEGEKYYINHETRTTSWVHPVTHVSAVPSSPSSSSVTSRRSSRSSSHHSLMTPPPVQATPTKKP